MHLVDRYQGPVRQRDRSGYRKLQLAQHFGDGRGGGQREVDDLAPGGIAIGRKEEHAYCHILKDSDAWGLDALGRVSDPHRQGPTTTAEPVPAGLQSMSSESSPTSAGIGSSATSARTSLLGLKTGTGRAATSTGSPVRGFRAMRVFRR